jgi:hypothetical protein
VVATLAIWRGSTVRIKPAITNIQPRIGRLFGLGGRARVRPAARVLVPDQLLDFGMGDGAAAMNQRRTVNAVGTASKILVSGRGLSPSAGPYLELFARETKPGWKCWGDQSGLFGAGAVAVSTPNRVVSVRSMGLYSASARSK